MSKPLHAFGREWCHQQFYGLLSEAIRRDLIIEFGLGRSKIVCSISEDACQMGTTCFGVGKTPWEALADALEKRERGRCEYSRRKYEKAVCDGD